MCPETAFDAAHSSDMARTFFFFPLIYFINIYQNCSLIVHEMFPQIGLTIIGMVEKNLLYRGKTPFWEQFVSG